MSQKDPLDVVKAQIRGGQAALQAYQPQAVDWVVRANDAATIIIPQLVALAPGLKTYVRDVLNAPSQLRSMWATIRKHVDLPADRLEAFDRQLTLDDVLRLEITGEVASNISICYLLEHIVDFRSNGRSDYPDIYLKSLNYSAIPIFSRGRSGRNEEYGAARKGREERPVRVPDGLEIKTCREQIRVDCHHPHAGLHLALVFREDQRVFSVLDLKVAFLTPTDYRESERNTTATTVKYSFNGDQFVSLFP